MNKALSILKHHWRLALLVSVVDFVFVLAITLVHLQLFRVTSGLFKVINEELQAKTAEFVTAPSITGLQFSDKLMSAYHWLIIYALVLFLMVFLIYTVLQGFNFALMARKLHKKVRPFIKQFLWVSGAWFTCLLCILFLTALIASSQATPIPLLSDNAIAVLAGLLAYALSFVAMTSYGLIPTKKPLRKTFKVVVKKIKRLAPLYLLLTGLMGALFYLVPKVFELGLVAFLAYLLVIFFPALYSARMLYLLKVSKRA